MKATIKKIVNGALSNFGYQVKQCQVRPPRRYGWLQEMNIQTVFDIGANTGGWASEMSEYFPNAPIYSFEPLPDCYEELKKVADKNPNITAFNMALGQENAMLKMNRCSSRSSSSLLKMRERHPVLAKGGEHTEVDVAVKRLDEVAAGLEIRNNIFIKIDVQGYELFVIEGGIDLIQRASALILETTFIPLYDGQVLFDELYARMQELGFRYMGDLESIKNPLNGEVLQGNGIFINQKKHG